jgi:ParB-like chromosome segregation protein Spo0J
MKYQLFAALDPAIEAALRSSIKRWGVLVPVAKDQHGNVLDGHHRVRIAEELGVDYRVDVHHVNDEAEAEALAQTLNTDRRHLDIDMRRQIVADLRSQGFSQNAIAAVVGVSQQQIAKDIAAVEVTTGCNLAPETIVGADGKSYPSTKPSRPEVQQAAEQLAVAEPERDDDDIADEALAIVESTDDIVAAVEEAVESRRVPMPVPKKSIAPGIPPHPATYPQAILDIFSQLIPAGSRVLDPFAGVGGIHKLVNVETVGIELEAEWAVAHPQTIHGDSRNASQLVTGTFDVIATSPAYGNRLADVYDAYDPQARRSYAIDLGRRLTNGSGAGLHFGRRGGAYEQLHLEVWAAVVPLLRPGGLFLLNCKDFRRNGVVMPVTGWHIGQLTALGLVTIDLRCVAPSGLAYADAEPLSELVIVMRKSQ